MDLRARQAEAEREAALKRAEAVAAARGQTGRVASIPEVDLVAREALGDSRVAVRAESRGVAVLLFATSAPCPKPAVRQPGLRPATATGASRRWRRSPGPFKLTSQFD